VELRHELHETNARLKQVLVGPRAHAALERSVIMEELGTKEGRARVTESGGGDDATLHEVYARSIVAHVETVLFASGRGIDRTRLLLLQLSSLTAELVWVFSYCLISMPCATCACWCWWLWSSATCVHVHGIVYHRGSWLAGAV